MTSAPNSSPTRATATLLTLRGLCELVAIISITTWAFQAWPLPLPGILIGSGVFALSVVVWALFLSPRPVLRTDVFGQSLIELLLIAGAVAALLSLGIFWVWPALYGIAAAVIGYVASMRTH